MFCYNSQNIIVFAHLLRFWSIFPVGFADFLREIPALPRGKLHPGSGISQTYIWHKIGIFQEYFRLISAIYHVYISYISCLSQEYLRLRIKLIRWAPSPNPTLTPPLSDFAWGGSMDMGEPTSSGGGGIKRINTGAKEQNARAREWEPMKQKRGGGQIECANNCWDIYTDRQS